MAGSGRHSSLLQLIAVLLLAGCSSAVPAATPSPTPVPADEDCREMSALSGAHQVRFGAGGETNLGGVIAGTGTTGIVLSHESDGSICDWAVTMPDLVGAGYRVLAFNLHGYGTSVTGANAGAAQFVPDVVDAAAALRADGATKIILMGASMGAAFSIAAAPIVQPPPAAVVSLSAPVGWYDADALDAAGKLKMPILLAAQQDDNQFGQNAKDLYQVARKSSPDARLHVTSGTTHGYRLYELGTDNEIRKAVNDFLSRYGR